MSNTPCHRTFSRNALAAYVQERIRDLRDELPNADFMDANYPPTQRELWEAIIRELERLRDNFELGKERPTRKRRALTRYDA